MHKIINHITETNPKSIVTHVQDTFRPMHNRNCIKTGYLYLFCHSSHSSRKQTTILQSVFFCCLQECLVC